MNFFKYVKNNTLCAILGHKWKTVKEFQITHGPRGKGTLSWLECPRCNEIKIDWQAELSLGTTKIKIPSLEKPSNMRKSTDNESPKRKTKKVSKSTDSNPS